MLLKPPQPIQYPDVVYKYRDWKNDFHKRVLLNHELFLSSPKNFNDPFDCKIPLAFEKLFGDKIAAKQYVLELVKSEFPDLSNDEYEKKTEEELSNPRLHDP